MKLDGVRLQKKKRSVMLVGFEGASAEKREALTHTWALIRWDWRSFKREKVELTPPDGQLLEKLESVGGAYRDEAKQAQALLVRLLLSKKAVEDAWEKLLAANSEALAVEATTHQPYPYARSKRSLSWRDSLTAPTPPHHSLKRQRSVRALTGGSKWLRGKTKEAEACYAQAYRAVDLVFLRPHLWVEVEPFATPLMARGQEVLAGLRALRKECASLLWRAEKAAAEAYERSLVPAVSEASSALRQLDARFAPPAEEEVQDLLRAISVEASAQEEGAAAYARGWLPYSPSEVTDEAR